MNFLVNDHVLGYYRPGLGIKSEVFQTIIAMNVCIGDPGVVTEIAGKQIALKHEMPTRYIIVVDFASGWISQFSSRPLHD